MRLRWSPYVAHTSPKGGSKTPNGRFFLQNRTSLEESLLRYFFVWNVSAAERRNCRAFSGLTIHAKIIGGGHSLLPEILGQSYLVGAKSPIFDLQCIFACSASAVTSREKSSILTNRKSTTRFPMSPRWASYVVPKPPRWHKNTKCLKFEQ